MKRLTLELDDALWNYLFAISRSGLHGDMKETSVYFLRTGVIDWMGSENLRKMVVEHLPPKMQKLWPRP